MKQTDDFQGPKYMNSPETLIYKKSELLYGLNLAKSAIKMAGAVIVVEGNLDVIASHKAGVENVVASSGTALTEQQIQLLKRFTDNIIFSFDQDAAGFAAAQRGIRLAQSLDMKVKVVILPPEAGKDPDDAVQKDPKLWIKAVDNPIPIMEYYFEQSSRNKDLSDVEHKREVGKFLIPEIASISDQIEQEHWLQKLSGMINIDIEILRGMVRKIKGEVYIKVVKKPEAKITKRSRTDQAVIMVLGLFLQYPEFQDKVMEKLDIEQIDSTELQDLYKILTNEYNKNNPSTKQKSFFAELREKISQNEESGGIVNLLDEIALKGEEISVENTQDNVLAQLNDFIHVINQAGIDQEKKQLEQQIRQAEEQGDSKVVQKLLEKFNSLN
jgi:DNA primase